MEFSAHQLIAAPPARVFDFVADPANEALWMDDDDDVSSMVTEHVDGPRSGVGARYRRTNVFGPRTATTTFAVVGFEPGRRIEFAGEDDAAATFLVEPVEGGDLPQLRARLSPGLAAVYGGAASGRHAQHARAGCRPHRARAASDSA